MKKSGIIGCLFITIALCTIGCKQAAPQEQGEEGPAFATLEQTGALELSYATEFSVAEYGEDYSVISIPDSGDYLVVAEGAPVPSELPDDMVVLQQPLNHIYNASSSTMDFFRVLDALDTVSMTGTKAEDWSIPEIANRVHAEEIVYAGKYSNPDYEYLLDDGCTLAIENTMIYHTPEVKETLENVGIPTLVERSSYEPEPLGRLEWVKMYGVLLDREEEAETYFDREAARVQDVLQNEQDGDGITAVYFYINTAGSVNVRKPGDYISKMISMAGGKYAIPVLEEDDDSASTTQNIQMETFYAYAKDADVLIYNGLIMGAPTTMEELLEMEPLLADFKAVQNHRVYCTDGDMFQQVSGTCDMILDFYHILRDEDDDDTLTYLYQLQ